ncbi:MAG: 30S ribosomal protein S6 [Candidatus Paceibacterota bacterium]
MKKVEKEEKFEGELRVYELGYLLIPTLGEEDAPAVYGNIKETISKLGGEFIMDEMPKMIPLAYTMDKVIQNIRHKFDSAYFGWVKFDMSPEGAAELKKKLDLDTNVLRFLITKTVRENTIAGKRFGERSITKKRVGARKEGEEAVEINKEEIDKEIDAMIE